MNFLKTRNGKIMAALVAVLLVVSGYLLFAGKPKVAEEPVAQDQSLKSISAEELGLTMEASPDKTKFKFVVAKIGDIKTIDYDIVYEADLPLSEQVEGSEPRTQRQIGGQITEDEIKKGNGKYESKWIDLGSCSRNVCKYDQGVTSIEMVLKIVKSDGKIYQAEKTLELE